MDNKFNNKLYDREEYFLSKSVEGYEEYQRGQISYLKEIEIDLLKIDEQDRFLDIGCGRGEVASYVLNITDQVAAIDASEVAIKLTKIICHGRADARQAFATELPFDDNSFDKILIGDVIEHLTEQDSYKMLLEAKRVLSPNGMLLIHTSPNSNFMKIIYPFAFFVVKIMRPEIADKIKAQVEESKIEHINEYSPQRLLKQCGETGFICNYKWIVGVLRDSKHYLTSEMSNNSLFKIIDKISKLPVLRSFLVNDLFLICKK